MITLQDIDICRKQGHVWYVPLCMRSLKSEWADLKVEGSGMITRWQKPTQEETTDYHSHHSVLTWAWKKKDKKTPIIFSALHIFLVLWFMKSDVFTDQMYSVKNNAKMFFSTDVKQMLQQDTVIRLVWTRCPHTVVQDLWIDGVYCTQHKPETLIDRWMDG